MSYILDALKKAEKERQRGTIPDMSTVQDIVAEKPKKRFIWAYLLVAILILNAGVFVWWLGFSHTKKAKVIETSVTAKTPLLSANDAAQTIPDRVNSSLDSTQPISPKLGPIAENSAPVIENAVSANTDSNSGRSKEMQKVPDTWEKISPHNPVSANNRVKPDEFPPAKAEQAESTAPLSSEPADALAEMPDENKIYKLRELPSRIQQSLPSFSIAALMYSGTPSSRMVRINNQMMYEGQDLTAGIKLEEITKDGVIFRHQKYRFYVGVK